MQSTPAPIRLSIVLPIYRAEKTLSAMLGELEPYTREQCTSNGRRFIVTEIFLVHDCGPDRSDLVIEKLVDQHPYVKAIWLSRNFGQHAATMAGMASSTGDWVITMDEDGQQNPSDFEKLLDTALDSSYQVVYAQPINVPPHGWLRNLASNVAKRIANSLLRNRQTIRFNSFRLVDGEIARTLAAYCSNGVYLDVGLHWIAGRIGSCPVSLRNEMDRPSGYSYLRLLGHFWRLVLSTGTQPLRLITVIGFGSVLMAILLTGYALYGKYAMNNAVPGWTSLLIVVSFFSGTTLTAIGLIAEYLAMTMGIVMGKPLYVISTKPTRNCPTK